MPRYGKTIAKVLELLSAGFLWGAARDREMRKKFSNQIDEVLYSIDRKQLNFVLKKFKLAGLVKTSKISAEKEKIVLTPDGRRKFLEYKFYNLAIKNIPRKWDKKWRMVLFDIPESRRKIRDALRKKLKQLGFLEFQKSVFVFPYPCEDEINFVINFFDIPEHVYYIEAPIIPDHELRTHFSLK